MGVSICELRLCIETGHPIDPGNYPGPIHCTAHPEGYPCATASYRRVPQTTFTAEDRQAMCDSMARGGHC